MTEPIHTEYIILGAGPAGLQMSWCLSQSGREHIVLEAGDGPGTFYKTYPRHGTLISINKVHTGFDDPEINLRWDWNSLVGDADAPRFADYTTEYFPSNTHIVSLLEDYARSASLPIRYETSIQRIERGSGGAGFGLHAKDGRRFTCRYLIVATGFTRENVPEIPGIEHAETYGQMSIDPEDFTGQRVCIIGKGNSAFETADHLVAHAACIHLFSPEILRFAWDTHYVGHLRAVNNNIIDTYQLKAQNTVNRADVVKIEPRDGRLAVTVAYTHAQGEVSTILYDRVLSCAGFRFDDSIFDDECKPPMRHCGRLPEMDHRYASPEIPGLYFAGSIMQARDYHKTMSGFIHGFRHNIIALARIFEREHHGTDGLLTDRLPRAADALTRAIVDRLDRSASMFLQPGYLGDIFVIDDDGIEHFEGVPLDYVRASMDFGGRTWLSVTLEYGKQPIDPFADERITDPERVHETFYLHPVIRRFRKQELVDVHHVPEDFENRFDQAVYTKPLERYAAKVLEPRRLA